MDIDARIERRRRPSHRRRLIHDYEAISPVSHVAEPTDRGPLLEALLDHLDPVFDGELPPDGYVHGPFGAGKSAVVTALFEHLGRLSTETRPAIPTSTRAAPPTFPTFVFLDARAIRSEFAFHHGVLSAMTDEAVPNHGIGTEALRERLHALLESSRRGAVVALDHADEPDAVDAAAFVDLFEALPNASVLAVGRAEPTETALGSYVKSSIPVSAYRRRVLVDVLMARASEGFARQALEHGTARRIADWADGNAHHALAALFVAADRADRAERARLAEEDVTEAIEEVPESSVSLGRVLSLPANKRLVLRTLIDLDPEDRESVTATTAAISADPSVDLSAGTVKRYLYEMAEVSIVERVRSESKKAAGRPPSRLALGFPPTAFGRLYDLQQ